MTSPAMGHTLRLVANHGAPMTEPEAKLNLDAAKWAISLLIDRLDAKWTAEGQSALDRLIDRHAWLHAVWSEARLTGKAQ